MALNFSTHKNIVSQTIQYFKKTKPTINFPPKSLSKDQGDYTEYSGKWNVEEQSSINPVISLGNLLLSQFDKNKFDFNLVRSFLDAIEQADGKFYTKNSSKLHLLERKPTESSDSSSDANSILNSIINIGQNPATAQDENQLGKLVSMFNVKVKEYLNQFKSIDPHGGKSFESGRVELMQLAHKLFSSKCNHIINLIDDDVKNGLKLIMSGRSSKASNVNKLIKLANKLAKKYLFD